MIRRSVKALAPKSLAGACPEIARVLADRDGMTFRADGTCMYPTLRPGDVLCLQSRAAADIQVGDIAVCRRPTHLFSHRVIAKGVKDAKAFIVTCPDRLPHKDDGPTFDDDLLGVVTAIKRRGKSVPVLQAEASWLMRRWFALRLAFMEYRLRVVLLGSEMLEWAQQKAAYQRAAKAWLRLARPQIAYRVRLPVPALGDAVFRQMAPEAFDIDKDWRNRPVQRWTLALHLNGASSPAAWMTFARGKNDIWAVAESFVSARYRGTGLAQRLLNKAEVLMGSPCGPVRQARAALENAVAGPARTVLARQDGLDGW